MKPTQNFTFLIADDHSIVRQGVSLLIKELFFNAKIHQAGNFKDTLKILRETKIDLLVLDINFPDGNSLNIIAETKNIQPNIKILIFSAYDEDIYALRYLNAGASGYLNKGSSEEEMKLALRSMMVSGKYITQNIKDRILDSYISKKPINPLELLSNREVEVARLLIKGYGNMEIAEYLNVKKSTVSTFKNRIFEKLEIDNLADLIDFFQLYN
ncbi:response regulator transcription factor [Flavobacterium sp. IMCC34852]|uniref:Response regulator transcription factor n=1 Tax=Flavobacterium rivulicola TaxID=2732161 RepID=A0A7Y3VYK7_9FLAO|nr:response regulator transcription factor [Flavobacterium sp. IMCC34852]NNT71506.1 response regulator transcription factor [Flavobacterium sp. IMCC34852]